MDGGERASGRHSRAERRAASARRQLRFLLAESSGEIDVTGTLARRRSRRRQPTKTCWRRRSRTAPSSASWRAQRGIYTELVTIAKARGQPRVDFSGAFGDAQSRPAVDVGDRQTWNAALVATVPLFDGQRTKGRVAQAQIDLSRADDSTS